MKKVFIALFLLLFGCSGVERNTNEIEGSYTVEVLNFIEGEKRVFRNIKEIEDEYLNGNKVIMVAHPRCHYCESAFLSFTPEMKQIFRKKGLILSPVQFFDRNKELKDIKEWNRQNGLFIHALDGGVKLKQIDPLFSFPIFYFFKDGELLGKLNGWPGKDKYLPFLKNTLKKM